MSDAVQYRIGRASETEIAAHLRACDGSFVPPLSGRVDVAEYAGKIAGNAPLSIRQAKKSVRFGMQMELQTALRFEAETYDHLVDTADRLEGLVDLGSPLGMLLGAAPELRGDRPAAVRALEIVHKADPEDFDAVARLLKLSELVEDWDRYADEFYEEGKETMYRFKGVLQFEKTNFEDFGLADYDEIINKSQDKYEEAYPFK